MPARDDWETLPLMPDNGDVLGLGSALAGRFGSLSLITATLVLALPA